MHILCKMQWEKSWRRQGWNGRRGTKQLEEEKREGHKEGKGWCFKTERGAGGRERCFQLYITVPEKALKCTDSRHRREMIRGANTIAYF